MDRACWVLAALLVVPSVQASAGTGSGAHVWMEPFGARTGEWYSFRGVWIAVDHGIAYATIGKLNLPQHHAPWGDVEARRLADGTLIWQAFLDEVPFGKPVVMGGHLFQLVGKNNNPGIYADEVPDGIIDLDAGTGQQVRRIDLPSGPGTMSGGDGFLYAAIGLKGNAPAFQVEVLKLNGSTGQVAWSSKVPGYNPSEPLVTGSRVLLNVGGQGTSALDSGDGHLVWTVPGLPSSAPVYDGFFAYVLHLGAPGVRPTVQQVEPTFGAVGWIQSLPWDSHEPCQLVASAGQILAYGSDRDFGDAPESVHAAALAAGDGHVAWHVRQADTGLAGCGLAASPPALFLQTIRPGKNAAEWALDATDGTTLWTSGMGVGNPVVSDGILLGLGMVRGTYDPQGPQEWGLLAVDAGAGAPTPPKAAFVGPSEVHMQDLVTFRDQSLPGDRSIVAWQWRVTDSQGDQVVLATGRNFTLRQNIVLDSEHVTLTVMDDQHRMASTTQNFTVLPSLELSHASPASFVLANVLLLLAVAWRRRL